MIYNFKLKEKAVDDLKGKWIHLIITVLILNLVLIVSTCVYDMLTIDLRAEVERITEEIALYEIEGDFFSENYLNLLNLSLAAEGALLIYDLINVVGSLIFSIFTLSIYSIHLNIAKGGNYEIKDFKGKINRFWESFKLNLLISVKIALWTLLFIIPGIVKTFAYSMSNYIKAEHPEYTCSQAIKESEKLMMGYKGQLFVFYLTFFGWMILSGVANMVIWTLIPDNNALLIIGNILYVAVMIPLNLYISQAESNFYLELKREKEDYEDYIKNRRFGESSFGPSGDENNRDGESINKSNPFSDFGEENKKETKEDNDPFTEF